MGLGLKESIQESSYNVFFSFLFHQRAFGNVGTGLCVGVGKGSQYADIEVTDFL